MPHRLRPVDLANEAGLSVQQIRNLEAAGLLPPADRTAAGQRIYTDRHRLALWLERTMVRAGFNGVQRRAVMHAAHLGDTDTALQHAAERFVALDELRRQVEATIAGATDHLLPVANARDQMRIGEAARLLGITPGALRHWELEGLIVPGREPANGYRVYNEPLLKRAGLIARLVDLGYGMAPLRQALAGLDQDDSVSGEAIETLLSPVRGQIRACAEATSLLWRYLAEPA